ncbi:hypothetical protein F0562_007382 [Nyssa sinensis]|uniref:Uncharacterized protein n=1 Tax=Nyssa sinensis TaxID=561372 RepID=A0A5J5A829_9ASTE|nr:hypothetical protein F0562_007382 [Nyssa sinensis]
MSCYRSRLLSLLTTILFFSLIFFSFSPGESYFPSLRTTLISGKVNERKYGFVGSLATKRVLVEVPGGNETVVKSSLVLAAKRTYRKDPLDGFERYTGGWNISERHYWAHWMCGLYTGQGKFHNRTTKTLEYVVNQADTTAEKLRNVSEYLAVAKQIGVDQVFLPSNVQTEIDQIQTKIDSSASTLSDQTLHNSNDIKDLLDSVRLALIVIAAVMLVLTFLGFLFSICGMQFLVYILVIIGWILVAGTFILAGIFLLLHNVTADTCVSMNEWVQYPTAHTALDDILPCVDNATAQETLLRSKEVTSQLVSVINQVITNVSNINFSPNFAPFYYNQSGPLMPTMCDPFNPDMTDRACTAGEVDLSNATQVWRNYVCQVSSSGVCITTGRVTPTLYNQMAAAVNVSYALNHYGPFLVDLEDCAFVRQTFSDIYRDHCPGLQRYSEWIYAGLVLVSTAVMLSLVFWVIYGRERRHRVYTKKHMARYATSFEGDKAT